LRMSPELARLGCLVQPGCPPGGSGRFPPLAAEYNSSVMRRCLQIPG